MAITVTGMFGDGKTYFADSPVVITVGGLEWPQTTPFSVVHVEVRYGGRKVGDFRSEASRQASIDFDISSALRAAWADYDFHSEVGVAEYILERPDRTDRHERGYRSFSVIVTTEYLASDGEFETQTTGELLGGRCVAGGYTEWERTQIGDFSRDVTSLYGTNVRYGDASTKPTDTPERVGSDSITSWVDVTSDGTESWFYGANVAGVSDRTAQHPPLVIRDSVPYADFLFVNRRGAVETCSAPALEAMQLTSDTKQYTLVERPAFAPSRSLMALGTDARRSWSMSSGRQTREWCEWWATEFLGGRKSRRRWMKYKGLYVPVIVEPAKKSSTVYDRSKQNMESVEFTVTMALEG